MGSDLFSQLVTGDRAALAKAITIIESRNPNHLAQADELLSKAIQVNNSSIRIGITGVPGVGKSTFINSFGNTLVKDFGKRLAVLAIDPSSNQSHGSILGDKTRMETLSVLPDVFIRPSPTAGNLGGVARKTRETVLLCEAAGYDTILIETVGVGQSEYVADSLSDCLLLLLLPNAGDELQGIKRGIMELADLVVLNKIDITEKQILAQAQADINNAIHLLPAKFEGWTVPVLTHALNSHNLETIIWQSLLKFLDHQKVNGFFEAKRLSQKELWLKEVLQDKLETSFFSQPDLTQNLKNALQDFSEGKKGLDELASELIQRWKRS